MDVWQRWSMEPENRVGGDAIVGQWQRWTGMSKLIYGYVATLDRYA